jgi:hypothetical protein
MTIALPERMDIRIVSTLTPDDERLMAPVILKAILRTLEPLPIAYMVRLDRSDAAIYQDNRPDDDMEVLYVSPAGQEDAASQLQLDS